MNVDSNNVAEEAVKPRALRLKTSISGENDLYSFRWRLLSTVAVLYRMALLAGYFALPWVNWSQQQAVLLIRQHANSTSLR